MRVASLPVLLALLAALAGCATTGSQTPRSAARDPLEPLNRAVFSFNDTVDRLLLEPAAKVYDEAVPELGKFMLRGFFGNIADAWTAVNNLLQGKPREAASDGARVAINSTFGFFGVADVASELGLEKHREDFGQTLGRWGVPPGPYLVLPFFGPSTVRDGLGLWADVAADRTEAVVGSDAVAAVNAVRIIDARARLLRAGQLMESIALDPYLFVRNGYLQRRRSLVYDGDPPPEDPADGPAGAGPR
ncbi:MAG: VacJ family lipoprotein [Burkholderiales bacterium]|nr:MAG: VacJ family lipoprotein [Burkholderiales bacterium]